MEYQVAEMDPKLTEEEIQKLPKMTFYYKYYGDQLMFREISPIAPDVRPFQHSKPLNGTLRYSSPLQPAALNLSRLNASCQVNHCATSLSPGESAYLFIYHPGDTSTLTETFILSFSQGGWLRAA